MSRTDLVTKAEEAQAGAVATDSFTPPPAGAATPRRSWLPIVGPLAVLALIIALWYAITYLVLDPSRRFLMPPPHEVITQGLFGSNAPEMLEALGRTTSVALTGLAIAFVVGVAWAVLMSQAQWAETSLFPYAVILQCIPILALVPLIGFWFGFGFSARVLVCVLIALFPIVSNTLFGLKSVDRGHRELFALHKTRRITRLIKLEFPAALPAMFAGLRISAGLAVVGAIVGDFFFKQGAPGIGILIDNYRSRLQSDELFAAILLASALGVLVFAFFGWLSNRVVGKWHNVKR
ncbi:ABC transporter permease [Rhodococcus rhodnii]|uniref:ABC transporter n=2 Tax=Rhodococcus rhodnii TaxID=38312 RepID=R7WHU0_9NOCA|nr:ABC transporter permease [Rhodococcus rhodnii]EOM74765.1 ABC transporter [Rhodococcus rhodnii LMG 5362]TXG89861.1 ABC transporter permease [Rhodococcus rhodnii]